MYREPTRRTVLGGIGAAVGAATLGTRVVGAEPMAGRFVVNSQTVRKEQLEEMEVVYDLSDRIGWLVVEGSESALPRRAMYAPDIELELELPHQEAGPTREEVDEEALAAADPLFYDLQWDKQEQEVREVHEETTGEGVRVGVVDSGILATHPDLTVNESLSRNLSGGPIVGDHGTHVAGIIGAAGNGVIGHAPDAELVDIQVFSGGPAPFSRINAAVVHGTDVGCDVLNLSLGSPPLYPVQKPADEITDEDDPDGDGPIVPISTGDLGVLSIFTASAGSYAVNNGTLPVASAGNSSVQMDEIRDPVYNDVVVLPAEAKGYMTVSATGPIGYGWPGASGSVAGLPVEDPIDTQLPTHEPAFYTNYGPDAVDVSAPGGNADIDALDAGVSGAAYDLVLSATFQQVGGSLIPSWGWKAGTSMAAPQVTGLAALLAAETPDYSPEEIRERIERTAEQLPVGRGSESTAPGADPNEAEDGNYDGDDNEGGDHQRLDSEPYRGEGHIDTLAALR